MAILNTTNKRRALGDIANNVKNHQSHIKLQQAQCDSIKQAKFKQSIGCQHISVSNDDAIELNTNIYQDNFNDILNDQQKLSNILVNAKCVPKLPTHGKSDMFNDTFHTQHVLNDKKYRKNIRKEGIY